MPEATSRTKVEGSPAIFNSGRGWWNVIALVTPVLVYGAVAAWLIGNHVHHYEWMVGALQFLIVPVLLRRKGACIWEPRTLWFVVTPFLVLSLIAGRSIGQGVMIPDESSYRFEARVLGSGRLMASPPPGAPSIPSEAPKPITFTHHVVSKKGWYSKYPIGWPLVLALPERLGWGWAANPVLGCLLIVLIGMIARELFGEAAVVPAVWMGVLSPYFLSNSVGYMPHACCGLLIAGAFLLLVQGIRTRKLWRFAAMLGLLVLTFHVRPFTALLASVSLVAAALICLRRDGRLLVRVAMFSAIAGLAAVASTMEYNRIFTGERMLSPYALVRGLRVPVEVTATPAVMVSNLTSTWRFSVQSMWVLCFPFVFVLAAIGLYRHRRSGAAWIAASLFGAVCVGHLVQVEPSSSVLGERYWFEAFFCVLTLASPVMARSMTRTTVWTLSVAQALLLYGAIQTMERSAEPRRVMRLLAEQYRSCDCVVFLKQKIPYFNPQHLNINDPDWQAARVFYLLDPGEGARRIWAARFGRTRWAVLEYDASLKMARLSSGESNL